MLQCIPKSVNNIINTFRCYFLRLQSFIDEGRYNIAAKPGRKPQPVARPMVCFVNVESVDRIIYSIFQRFNLDWKNRTLKLFAQAA